LLEHFHRRHPRAPRPQRVVLDKTYPVNDSVPPPSASTVPSPDPAPDPAPPAPAAPAAVPSASRRTPTPPPLQQNLRSNYVPPTVTTTRSGRASRPAERLDPVHVPKPRRSAKVSALVLPPALEGG
jgi:hypothetical protein